MSDTPQRRIALVTGASRGIGRGIAIALAQFNHDVAINFASNANAAEEVQHEIKSRNPEARVLLAQADISKTDDRTRLIEQTLDTFGRIDLLVNNAGVAPAIRADLLEASEESFDRLININLKGPYFLTQLVARRMIEISQQSKIAIVNPTIVTISSVSAYAASINRGDYCVAKAGLAMMTKLFAARLAEHGINVYEIRPGVIDTDMTGAVKEKYNDLIFNKNLTPLKRWGQPEDIAKAVVAIANGSFPFSTGEVINVDGGFHFRRL